MGKVAIITDSTACLPKEVVRQYAITVLPVNIVFEDKVYRDEVDAIPGEFYRLLEGSRRPPATSPPSPGAFLEAYRQAASTADAILCITVAARFSSLFNAARLAKEMSRDMLPQTSIRVLDSGTASMAHGFVVLEAARAAAQGRNLEGVSQVAEGMIPRVNLLLVMDTLYYLAKTGRIPRIASWAASLIKIKPILTVANGEVNMLARARTKARAVEQMIALMRERVGMASVHVAVLHAYVPEESERLKAQVSSGFKCVELYISEFTPVMGTFTGPGLVGLAFYSDGPSELG